MYPSLRCNQSQGLGKSGYNLCPGASSTTTFCQWTSRPPNRHIRRCNRRRVSVGIPSPCGSNTILSSPQARSTPNRQSLHRNRRARWLWAGTRCPQPNSTKPSSLRLSTRQGHHGRGTAWQSSLYSRPPSTRSTTPFSQATN